MSSPITTRRRFVSMCSTAAVASVLPCSARAQASAPQAGLTIDPSQSGATIPENFTGLSYEAAQLANPAFFASENKALIDLFHDLSPSGVLRIGGGSSEFTSYSDQHPAGPAPFEVFGPDTSKTLKSGTITSALALRNLRAFLDATNWSCLYGLNLGQGSRENAVKEAAAASRILGPRLQALQIGNEPDSFRNRYRPATYGPADFMAEWNTFHEAIAAAAPGAKFAGPDISNKQPFLTAFAVEAPQHADVILLTGHYYAMGPAGSPDATLDQLSLPEPRLATVKAHNLEDILAAMRTARLPYRMSEGNSCWDGGKPGVSDTLASALWCADYMLRCAQLGFNGVNLHGGGNGFYTPIAGAPSMGFTKRPEFFGMQFAQRLVGATFLGTTLTGMPPQISAYALKRGGENYLAAINKSGSPAHLPLPSGTTPKPQAIVLTGPSLDSKVQPSLGPATLPAGAELNVPARSAVLYTI